MEFITAETGSRKEDSINTIIAAATFFLSCMVVFYRTNNRKFGLGTSK